MKSVIAFTLALGLSAAPLAAQDEGVPDNAPESEPDGAGGLSLMEEGARLFFRGLMSEMEPAIDELEGLSQEMRPALRDFVAEMGPAFRDLMTQVQDWSAYHPPEILPNGDIIIRRRETAPPDGPGGDTGPDAPDTDAPGGEIEL